MQGNGADLRPSTEKHPLEEERKQLLEEAK